jgi:hypothetical protein
MKKFTFSLKIVVFVALMPVFYAFTPIEDLEQYIENLQKSFENHYDFSQESDVLKKYDLNITNTGFCRYKRFYNNGKTEYFAFKLSRFKDLNYTGSTASGKLLIYTKSDDIIVQTHNDRAGDVDSMATSLTIPLKNIEPEDLNLIKDNLSKISNP